MLQRISRRPVSIVTALSLVVTAAFTFVATSSSPVSAARQKATKYEVCHRTNAIKNPYRRITVAWSSVDNNGNGHDAAAHDGPVFNISNPAASHGTTPRDSGLGSESGGSNNRWGDIFRASRLNGTGNNLNEQNWTTAGQAIFNGATFTLNGVTKQACRTMSANDLIKAEKEENPNKLMADIMAELDDQGATEDEALKQSLGGSFTTWYSSNGGGSEDPNLVTSLISAESPKVTTEPPTNVAASSATLKGTISPKGTNMDWYFEWSTSSNLDSPTVPEETATVSTTGVNTTQNVSANITGLTSGTTYYYRTVGVVSNGLTGTDLVETYLYGVVKQFVYGAPAAPTIDSLTCGNTKLTVAFTANANVTNVTGYEYSVDGGTYALGKSGSASGSFDITGLTNGVSVLVSIRAITSTTKGIDSIALTGSACGAPTPVTDPATSVQNTSATINGTVTSNGAPTTVTFTWGTDSQLTSPAPTVTAAAQSPLASDAVLPVTLNLTGLTANTTYYFQVNASSTGGSGSGIIRQFTTPAAALPTTTTTPASSVTTTSATLNGTGTSNGAASDVVFKWGTDPTLTSGTTDTNAAQNPLASNASGTSVTAALTGLIPYTTYYFRTIITNTNGTASGIIRSFTTLPEPPTAITDPATSITSSAATLNGSGDPNLFSSDISFKWGTDPSLTSNTTTTNAAESPLPVGGSSVPVTLNITGLTGGTTYYFRVIITNVNGTASGNIRQFTTLPPAPEATTDPATLITETTATLNGTGDPNGASSDVSFEWGTDPSLASNTTTTYAAQSPLPVGSSPVPVTLNITGLTTGTTYYFQVTITNVNGTALGIIRQFTTETPIAPSSGPTTTAPSSTPTTTIPPTTVAPASTSQEIGRVIGTAWFDGNRNNKRDNNEPLLASIPIELVPVGVTAQAFNGVRKTALLMNTGSDGSFDFTSVPSGTYRIVGNLPSGYGIDKSWDTTGNDDWNVNVTVVAAKVARGDFAAVGSAVISGCYSGQIEATQLAATWNGFDKKLGTVDDAVFTSKIGQDCNFDLPGVPLGTFEVAAKSEAGKVVSKASMNVTSQGGRADTPNLSVKAKIVKVLPQTGSRQLSDVMMMAMLAIIVGAATIATSRRRRRL